MANTLLTTDQVVHYGAAMLSDQLTAARLAVRDFEGNFNGQIGQTLRVAVPNIDEASNLPAGGTTTATDITETKEDLKVEKHFVIRRTITPEQLTFSLDQFLLRVMKPAMQGIARSIEKYAADKLVGFIGSVDGGTTLNATGTLGNNPSTHAHLLAGRQEILQNLGDIDGLVGYINPTVETSFAQLNLFTNRDFGERRSDDLIRGALGPVNGIDWYTSPYTSTFDQGDVAGTVLLNGAGAVGDTEINVDGFTAASGTVKEGTAFTIAGTATIYTVSQDADIASNAATLKITPALTAIEADNDAITFQTAPTHNVIYNPNAFAGVIVAPPAVSANTSFAQDPDTGIQLRIISETSTSTTSTDWVFEVYAGYKALRREHGVVFQG